MLMSPELDHVPAFEPPHKPFVPHVDGVEYQGRVIMNVATAIIGDSTQSLT
jgi:hypothetical protein